MLEREENNLKTKKAKKLQATKAEINMLMGENSSLLLKSVGFLHIRLVTGKTNESHKQTIYQDINIMNYENNQYLEMLPQYHSASHSWLPSALSHAAIALVMFLG